MLVSVTFDRPLGGSAMRQRIRSVAALSAVLIVTAGLATAAAAARPQEKRTLTLEQCLELGLSTSKGLHASQMAVEAMQDRLSEARAARLASVRFSGGYTRLSEVPPFEVHLPLPASLGVPSSFVVSPNFFNNYSLRLGIQQPLFTGFRLQATEQMARLNAGASEQDFVRDKAETAYAIRSAYWSLVKARESRRVIEDDVEQVKAHLTDVRNFFDQGLLTRNDVLKVEVQLSSVRLARLDALNAEELAAVWLNNLIGAPLDQEIEPATSVETLASAAGPAPEESPGLDKLLQKAASTRPELLSLDLRVRAREAGVRVAESGWYPQVSLTGNIYGINPNPRLLPSQNKLYGTWDVGITLSFDVWNWKTTAYQTGQARAQLAQAVDALGQMRDSVAVEVRQSWLTFQESKERIGLAKVGVDQAAENLRETRDRFKEGVALNTDVLDAETALLQARLSYTQALVDSELARARLIKAAGGPD
jgi:outer membrane protein